MVAMLVLLVLSFSHILSLSLAYPASSVLGEAEKYLIKYGYLSQDQSDVKLALRSVITDFFRNILELSSLH